MTLPQAAFEYIRVLPEQVEGMEARGWRVAGATPFALDDLSVLLVREVERLCVPPATPGEES